MRTVLYTLAETIRNLALLTQPFMPTASGAILDQLAVAEARRSFATAGQGGRLAPGTALPKPAAAFPRPIDQADLSPLCPPRTSPQPPPRTPHPHRQAPP